MSQIQESIDVKVPISAVYNQWTQFESFPEFMESVDKIRQTDDTHLHWAISIDGVHREFDAKITEQLPDERVAWTSLDGPRHAGVVTFHRLDENTTRVMLQLDHEPAGAVEKAGEWLGFVERQAKGDLKRFKEYIEARGAESGAWRGKVDRPTP